MPSTMISGQSLFSAAQIVALGTLFPLFPAHPFSVWSNAYNTGALSTSLQQWRTLGRYYLYTDRKSSWYDFAHCCILLPVSCACIDYRVGLHVTIPGLYSSCDAGS